MKRRFSMILAFLTLLFSISSTAAASGEEEVYSYRFTFQGPLWTFNYNLNAYYSGSGSTPSLRAALFKVHSWGEEDLDREERFFPLYYSPRSFASSAQFLPLVTGTEYVIKVYSTAPRSDWGGISISPF
ncbi:hypothetical protein [Paenibacillus chitinolyticus]